MKLDPQQMSLDDFNAFLKNTLCEALEMTFLEVSPKKLVMRMPVQRQSHQPVGLLHGGATAALVESIASTGSMYYCPEGFHPVGVQIDCHHLKSKRSGYVDAIATPLHCGRSVHMWNVDVVDEEQQTIAVGRCTIAVVKARG